MRRVKEEVDLHDQVSTLKDAVTRLQGKVKHLSQQVAMLHAERDSAESLPEWCDEEMYVAGEKNLKVPWLKDVHNIRAESVLARAKNPYYGLITSTRDLISLSHERALEWENFGKKSLNDVLRALEIHKIRWPSAGRQEPTQK